MTLSHPVCPSSACSGACSPFRLMGWMGNVIESVLRCFRPAQPSSHMDGHPAQPSSHMDGHRDTQRDDTMVYLDNLIKHQAYLNKYHAGLSELDQTSFLEMLDSSLRENAKRFDNILADSNAVPSCRVLYLMASLTKDKDTAFHNEIMTALKGLFETQYLVYYALTDVCVNLNGVDISARLDAAVNQYAEKAVSVAVGSLATLTASHGLPDKEALVKDFRVAKVLQSQHPNPLVSAFCGVAFASHYWSTVLGEQSFSLSMPHAIRHSLLDKIDTELECMTQESLRDMNAEELAVVITRNGSVPVLTILSKSWLSSEHFNSRNPVNNQPIITWMSFGEIKDELSQHWRDTRGAGSLPVLFGGTAPG